MPAAPDLSHPVLRYVRGRADACPGALRLHPAADGSLARVRVPGGRLTVAQARVLGAVAAELGDGDIHLTSRGNVQLRALPAEAGPALGARFAAVGLLPSPGHDRARNIVASPLSGLDGCGFVDASPWVSEVDSLLCSRNELTQLSGRFLIGLDDGRGDIISLRGDVTVVATEAGRARLRLADQNTRLTVAACDAARLAVDATTAFLRARAARGSDAWRVAELPGGVALVGQWLRAADYVSSEHADHAVPTPSLPGLGLVTAVDGTVSLSVRSRLGRVNAAQWRSVLDMANAAAGTLRITPWRGIVIPRLASVDATEALSTVDSAGFVTHTDSPWAGASACTGRPGCARSLTDVHGDAATTLSATAASATTLPVHFSGCERRCGRPSTDHVEVVAGPAGYGVGLFGHPSAPVARDDIADAVQSARRKR